MNTSKNYSWDDLELENEVKKIFYNLLNINSEELRNTFSKSYQDLNTMIKITNQVIEIASQNNWNDILTIWNAIGYMLYISLESKNTIEVLVYEPNFDKQRIYIKNLINLIYESISDLEVLLGGKLSKEVRNLDLDSAILEDLKIERNKIQSFKKLHFSDLQLIRNAFGSHRDHNFSEYNKIYNSIEKTSIIKLAFIYDDILNSLGKPITIIMKESSTRKNKL